MLAGLAGSVQVAVMGRFGSRIGVFEALTFASCVQLVLSLAILLVARRGLGNLDGALEAPRWMWAGGAMGLLIVLTVTFAQPRIGATATIGILIAGQLVMGALVDRFGLFGVDQIAITWPRLLGIGLLGAGAALSLSKSSTARHVSHRARMWTALWAVYIIWGSTYLGIAVAGDTIPPLLAVSTRFIFAGALMAGIVLWRGGTCGSGAASSAGAS